MVAGVQDPLAVERVPYRQEGKVPTQGRLVIDHKKKELVKDKANIVLDPNFKGEGGEEWVPCA